MQNNELIIVAHGSRKESSNSEVILLGENVKPLVDGQYDVVKTAFSYYYGDTANVVQSKAVVKPCQSLLLKSILLVLFAAVGYFFIQVERKWVYFKTNFRRISMNKKA